ncbi:hypothetical protein PMAYCL1PPCAC_01871, partial [Pristionchus mayeri]
SMCGTIKPMTHIIFNKEVFLIVESSLPATLRLATILIEQASDWTAAYNEEIRDVLWKKLRYSEDDEVLQEVAWTLGAMAKSHRDVFRDYAFEYQEDLETLIDESREEDTRRKTTEKAIYALVCRLSVVTEAERRADPRTYDKFISKLVKEWLPINEVTEAFETVYSYLATLIRPGNRAIRRSDRIRRSSIGITSKTSAIDIDENLDRLLLIIGSALSKEGIWVGKEMIGLK